MKVKIFEVVLHKLPSGKSPATALEEQLNLFLGLHPDLRLITTHMSTLVARRAKRHARFGTVLHHFFSARCSIPSSQSIPITPCTD